MKTMAQFKRDAASGKMNLELYERDGSADFPERLKGIRKVKKINSVEIILVNQNGEGSSLRLGKASLMDYDDDSLIIYNPGFRDLTEQEKAILAQWEIIQEDYLKANSRGDVYWKRKNYFRDCPCPWLYGIETVKGKKLMYDKQGKPQIRDDAIKGDALLKYRVYMEI